MFTSTINTRKTITYIFCTIIILGFYEYFWSDLPSLWQKIAMIITAAFLFSLIKEFTLWIFSRLSSFWSYIFKIIIIVLGFLLAWFYIFTDYSDSDFKENHTEIRNDVRNFFALPTSPPFTGNNQNVLVVTSPKEVHRDPLVNLLINNNTTVNTHTTEEAITENNTTQKTELQYTKDANKNWKIALQKELHKDEELIFSRQIKSKVNTTAYKPTATIRATTKKDEKNSTNYLYFTKTPVQVVYPQNYSFKDTTQNTVDEKNGLIEAIKTTLIDSSTQKTAAKIEYKIYTSGKLYDKYINEFITTPSSSTNTFYIESTTPNSVQYVTFFAGKCWEITITKDGKNNILDDFYKVLIPAVFEAQD